VILDAAPAETAGQRCRNASISEKATIQAQPQSRPLRRIRGPIRQSRNSKQLGTRWMSVLDYRRQLTRASCLTFANLSGMLCALCNVTWMVAYVCREVRQNRFGSRARTETEALLGARP
jgi:hypothetical protein